MGLRTERVLAELKEFYAEVVVENGPRYRRLREWPHLYVDLWVSICSMSYTMGHILAVAVPIWLIVR